MSDRRNLYRTAHGRLVNFEEKIQGIDSNFNLEEDIKTINSQTYLRVFPSYESEIKMISKNTTPIDTKIHLIPKYIFFIGRSWVDWRNSLSTIYNSLRVTV